MTGRVDVMRGGAIVASDCVQEATPRLAEALDTNPVKAAIEVEAVGNSS